MSTEEKNMEVMSDTAIDLDNLFAVMEEEASSIDGTMEEEKELTRGDAEYFIKKYKALLAEEEKIVEHANAEMAKIKDWLANEKARLALPKTYIETTLRRFAEKELEGSKSKTLRLIQGNLSFRKVSFDLEYDEEKLRSTLPEEFLERKVSVKISALKKLGTVVGDKLYLGEKALEGVKATVRPDSFSIK